MLLCFRVTDDAEYGLMTVGTLFCGTLVLVGLVANRALLVSVGPLSHVTCRTRSSGILASVPAMAIEAVAVWSRIPSGEHRLNGLVTLDALCCLGLERVRLVATRATLVVSRQLRFRHFRGFLAMAPDAEIRRLRARAMYRMTLGAVAVSWDVCLYILVDNSLVTRGTVATVTSVGGVRTMGFVAQPTSINVAVDYRGRYRLRLGRGECLTGLQWLSTVASGATRGPWVASVALLKELVTRQAGDLVHAMLMHLHLVVTCST